MRIATWNVNSVRARLPRLVAWLEREKPDVLCLQELKVEDALFPADDMRDRGYECAVHGQKTWNGVAIVSRLPLSDVQRGLGDAADDPQSRFVAATVGGVRIASAYCPNGQTVGGEKWTYKLAWLARLRAWLDRIATPAIPLAICGDFNVAPEAIDVHDPGAWEGEVLFHPRARAALADVCAFPLVDTFRRLHPGEPGHYSWWDYRMLGFPKNRGLRIDHILTTPALAELCTAASIDREERKGKDASDHAPVVATFA